MRKTKRCFSLLLVFVMLFTLLPTDVFAVASGLTVSVTEKSTEAEKDTEKITETRTVKTMEAERILQSDTELEERMESETGTEERTESETGTEKRMESETDTEERTESETGTEKITEAKPGIEKHTDTVKKPVRVSKEEASANEIDINSHITEVAIGAKLSGDDNYTPVEELKGDGVTDEKLPHVGTPLCLTVYYENIINVNSTDIYYISIPDAIKVTNAMTGNIKNENDENIGTYKVNPDTMRIELRFAEDFLIADGYKINKGNSTFYGEVSEKLRNDPEHKVVFNDHVQVEVPVSDEVTAQNIHISKMNGTNKEVTYDARNNRLQYTIVVNTKDNTETVSNVRIQDIFTKGAEYIDTAKSYIIDSETRNGVVTEKKDIKFSKENGIWTWTVGDMKPNTTCTLTYWVPLKNSVTKADFQNTATELTTKEKASVDTNLSLNFKLKKTASKVNFDSKNNLTTIDYSITITACEDNTETVKDIKVVDWLHRADHEPLFDHYIFGDQEANITLNKTNKNEEFDWTVDSLAPGESKTLTFTAVMKDNLWASADGKNYNQHTIQNDAAVRKSDGTPDMNTVASAITKLAKSWMGKRGSYVSSGEHAGTIRFEITYNGTVPDSNPIQKYDDALKSMKDTLETAGYVYDGEAELTAYKNLFLQGGDQNGTPQNKNAQPEPGKSTTMNIDGKTAFEITVPEDMKGPYDYKLVYYVRPADGSYADKVILSNSVSGSIGIGSVIFGPISKTEVDASYAINASLKKSATDGYNGNEKEWNIELDSAIHVPGLVITDTLTDSEDGKITNRFTTEEVGKLIVKKGETLLKKGEDYEAELEGDQTIHITLLKAQPDISADKKLMIKCYSKVNLDSTQLSGESTTGGLTYSNTVSTNIEGLTAHDTAEDRIKVEIEKQLETIDYKDQTISWQIAINADNKYTVKENNQEVIKYYDTLLNGDYQVKDILPAGLDFVEAKLGDTVINGITTKKQEDGTTVVSIPIKNGPSYGDSKKMITVTTKINETELVQNNPELNIQGNYAYTFKNQAEVDVFGTILKTEADAIYDQKKIEKSYEYTEQMMQQRESVKFILNINPEKEDLNPEGDTLTIKDTMNPALGLDESSLQITDTETGEVLSSEEYRLEKEVSNEFILIVPDEKNLKVEYYAKIFEVEGETGWLDNSATIEGIEATTQSENHRVAVYRSASVAEGDMIFALQKTDSAGNNLPGAVFELKQVSFQDNQLTESDLPEKVWYTEDGNGLSQWNGLEKLDKVTGKGQLYVLYEAEAPSGYQRVTEPMYVAFTMPNADAMQYISQHNYKFSMVEAGVPNAFKFKNKYVPQVLAIPVEKLFSDDSAPRPTQETYSFTLKAEDGAPESAASENGQETIMLKEGEQNSFSEIQFEETGTYHYTITEKDAGDKGYRYAEPQTVEVMVREQNGALEVKWRVNEKEASKVTFVNEYHPLETTIELPVTKIVTAEGHTKPENQSFDFILNAESDAPESADAIDGVEKISVKDGETKSFSKITFDKEGTYTYTVAEQDAIAKPGYTYAPAQTVKVTVTDNAGQLEASSTVEEQQAAGLSFTNKYKPDEVGVTLTAKKSFKDSTDRPIKKYFTFELLKEDGTTIESKQVEDEGTVNFTELTFQEAGTYTYKMRERKGTEKGYTYDETVRTILITVTEEKGILSASWKVDGQSAAYVEFTNAYKPEPEKAVIPVQKKIAGMKPSKKTDFQFVLEAKDYAPMPEEGDGKLSLQGEGTDQFELVFTKAGTYKYEVYEVQGQAAGYSYDTKLHKIEVTVIDEDGALKASWTLDGKEASEVVFTNTYQIKKHKVPKETETNKTTESTQKTTSPQSTSSGSPKTGDTTNTQVWWMILSAAAAMAVGAFLSKYKKCSKNKFPKE